MSIVVFESGAFVLMAKYLHQKVSGGVWYFRRRLPDDVKRHYPDNRNGALFYSLKTKDFREATKLAHRDALGQDAMWKAIRNGDVSYGPGVVEAAIELLRSQGLNPGDAKTQLGEDAGLEPFFTMLELEAIAHGAPRGSHEASTASKHWAEFLPPTYKIAADMLYGSKPPVFLSQALQEHLDRKGENENSGPGLYRVRIVNEFISHFGDQPIEQYSRDDANQFVQVLLKKGNKHSTVVRRMNSIRPVFKAAAREHELEDRRIFEALYIPKTDAKPSSRIAYTEDEIRLVQAACRGKDDDLRWIVALMSDSGMRLGEVVGLKVEDVHITGNIPYVSIEPNEARSLKTSGSVRKVPLVGASLWAAQRALGNSSGVYLFGRYVRQSKGKMTANTTAASQTLVKWLRSLPIANASSKGNHSFRHAIQDRLRAKQTPPEIRNAICGWKEKGVGQMYGEGFPLAVLRNHLSGIVLE